MFKYDITCIIGFLVGALFATCTPRLSSSAQIILPGGNKDQLMGTLNINPSSNIVDGKILYCHYLSEKEISEGLSFYLPVDFAVRSISGKYVNSYVEVIDSSSYIGKFLKTIRIQLNSSISLKTRIELDFDYTGKVDLKGFAEMDYPTPWIEVSPNTLVLTPIPTNIPEARYNLRINLPSDYQIVSPGKSLPNAGGGTIIDSEDHIKGVYFIIGRQLDIDHCEYKHTTIQLVSYKVPQTIKDRIGEMVGHTIDLYNNTFGNEDPVTQVTIALRPSDQWDASFAAGSNYFVTYDSQNDFVEKEEDYYAIYAHEMAHFWWKEGAVLTSDNWLNEGFAEFSSLLAVKSFYGEGAFENKIQHHRKIVKNIPDGVKLATFERFGKYDQSMAYSAGALLLHEIYQALGSKAFQRFLTGIVASKINTTAQFVAFLRDHYSGTWVDQCVMKIQ